MGWREKLRPASFRGVPFQVDSSEFSGGRRTVEHEYPLRDGSYSEDMGRKARSFSIDAYVVGDDYMDERDALLAALESAGPGELVHPYHGTHSVVLDGDFRVRETSQDGGYAVFSLTFRESEEQPPYPSAKVDASAQTLVAAASVRASIEQYFTQWFHPNALIAGISDALRSAALTLDNAASMFGLDADAVARLRGRIDTLVGSAVALVAAPAELVAALVDLFDDLPSVDAALAAYYFDPGPRPPATTASRICEQESYDALVALVRVLSVTRAAEVAVGVAYETYDAAVSTRDQITELLDAQAEVVGDAAFTALEQLRADLASAVPGEANSLPRLVAHTPAVTVPSLVLAHRLYGDVQREPEIVARNRIERPGFIIGGTELEVLSDG